MSFWAASAVVPPTGIGRLPRRCERSPSATARARHGAAPWWSATPLGSAPIVPVGLRWGRSAWVRSPTRSGGAVDGVQPSLSLRERALRLLASHPVSAADALQLAAALQEGFTVWPEDIE